MALLLGVLAIALVLVAADPALAQAVDDQYGSGPSGSVGEHAANAAVTASQAWEGASEGLEEDATLLAGEESGPASEDVPKGITKLPETGGPSTLSFGILLVVAGVLVRGITRGVFRR